MEPVRDFIPEGGELSGAEKERFGRGIPTHERVYPDFTPSEGHVTYPSSREVTANVAREAALAAAILETGSVRDNARSKLNDLNAKRAVEFISTLSDASRHIYLEVEAENQARKSVLSKFPTPATEDVSKDES